MTNRMGKLDRKTNEAIATIFRTCPAAASAVCSGFSLGGAQRGVSHVLLCLRSGQRLQSMKKDKDPSGQVDLVAGIHAAEQERDDTRGDVSSDEE